MRELHTLTIRKAHDGLKNGDFTSLELTKACLGQIKKRNKNINAFISVFDKDALEEASKADELISKGRQKVLTGIPFSVKDAICTLDSRSTGAAKILDNYRAPYEATVITKIREQSAVLLGKTNCDSFGHGASNENSMYGPVRNPHDEKRVAGGSSGGAAAAVADNQCIFSIAEDTGGSIRQPASFCGVVGLRPSYGRNSRYGIMPMASSLDTVGPITKTVEDTAILMEIMAGKDEKDATTYSDTAPMYTKEINKKAKKLNIGIPKEYFEVDGFDEEVKKSVLAQIDTLREAGHEITEINLPMTEYAIAVYYILVPSEDSSNLGRLDGIRYGVREKGKNLGGVYAASRAKGFPDEVKRRIMTGTFALSYGYYDAYYKKAQKVRTLISQDFEKAFENVDLILTPTAPTTAFKLGEKKNDVIAMYLADVFVCPAAIAGLPAISIPVGKDNNGLPIGMQIIGPRLGEIEVLSLAARI
ncbi:MAG: Asp-tRNA(Asn)/Glu-tRNA(Gln) amidotransferase subunit GatA [Candidatus Magasanikbacteria bacterium]